MSLQEEPLEQKGHLIDSEAALEGLTPGPCRDPRWVEEELE